MSDLTLKIEEAKKKIEDNAKAVTEKIEELKLIKGDTVISNKIKKLCESLPQADVVEGVTVVFGNREIIENACKGIAGDSENDIKTIELEIAELKADTKKQLADIKKLEKFETEYNEMMGILPEKEAVKTEGE